MACTSCNSAKSKAKVCPKCGRRFIGSAKICGYCAAKSK